MDINALLGMLRGHGQMFAGGSPTFQEKGRSAPMYDPPGAGGAAAPAPAVGIDEPQIQSVAPTHGMDFMSQLLGMLNGGTGNAGMFPQAQARGLPQSRPMGSNPLMMFMQNLHRPRGR